MAPAYHAARSNPATATRLEPQLQAQTTTAVRIYDPGCSVQAPRNSRRYYQPTRTLRAQIQMRARALRTR